MNFVILDLEWDSAYFVKEHRFINQIIQIGAVKLDENLNIIDTFQKIVKSAISKRLTPRFVELTGISKQMMSEGMPLYNAVEAFNNWAGKDKIILTWSNSDLFAIYEKNFSTPFTIYQVLDNIRNGNETKLTNLYYELYDRQHEIVEKMKLYKEMNKKEEYII